MRRRAWIAALGLFAACAVAPKKPATNESDSDRRAKAEAALETAERALAEDIKKRGAAEAIADRFQDEGALLVSEVPIRTGPDAVRTTLAQTIKTPLEWRTLLIRAAASGDFGFSIAAAGKSKALTVWRLEGNEWRIAALMKNSGAVTSTGAMASVPGGRPWPIDTDQEEKVLLALDADFSSRSVASGRADAYDAFAADDAVLFDDGGPLILGRRSIAGSFAKMPEAKVLVWSPRIAGVAVSGELGFTVRESRVKGENQKYYGKYLTIWRWTAKDGWKFAADGGNESQAPTIAPRSTRR